MEHGHVGLGKGHLLFGEDIAVLQTDIVFLVEETLLLDAGHVEDVQLGHGLLEAAGLLVGDVVGLEHVGDDVVRHPQLLGADEDEADVLAARHGLDEGVDGASKLEVAAQADGQVVQTALAAADGHQVGHGLGRVLVAAVACVDDRDAGVPAGPQRCALLGVAHGHDVGVAGDDADGVGHALALGCTGDGLAREAEDMSAEIQHRGLKRKTGAGGRLVEQGGQLFVGGHVLIGSRVGADAVGQVQQRGDLLLTEIQRID